MVGLFINELGEKFWECDGLTHRLNGPAIIIFIENYNESLELNGWWYKGDRIECKTQEEFDRLIRLRLLW